MRIRKYITQKNGFLRILLNGIKLRDFRYIHILYYYEWGKIQNVFNYKMIPEIILTYILTLFLLKDSHFSEKKNII